LQHTTLTVWLAATAAVIRVNWTRESADTWAEWLQQQGTLQVSTLLRRHGVRERLADALCTQLSVEGKKMCELKKTERQALLELLTAYPLNYTGHEGYKKAEVTGGGVPLSEVDCKDMGSRVLPGVHLCGEVLDVFGRIGGFNFYWAWVSGRLAGLGAAGAVQGSEKKAGKGKGKGKGKEREVQAAAGAGAAQATAA
jgi:predicted flavoprotein YhiN